MTTRPATAVLYLRSSKDRSDVSIEAQRHELERFAADKGLAIVGEYVDVVESGKDEDRPGFLRLYDDLRSRSRTWSHVIALDTSRVARRRRIAIAFEETECAKRGVTVLYKSLAGVDAESEILLKSVLQGADEWHSLVSRRKSLAGMSANVRRGYRAGGRAPIGYKLSHHDTGAVREGRPVLKSKLEIDDAIAPAMTRYLKARAAGARRPLALRECGLDLPKSSLVGVEWNALTYAGATVWNVHAPMLPRSMRAEDGAYVGGSKRRPRSEWQIQRDTHPALITEEEAERILANLAAYSVKRPRRTSGDYLLTGLLKTSDGVAWHGDSSHGGRYYRVGTQSAPKREVEEAVLAKVAADLRSREFAARIVQRLRRNADREHQTEAAKLKAAITSIDARISRFMDMAAKLESSAPVLRKIDQEERERRRLEAEVDALQGEARIAAAAKKITEAQVLELLDGFAGDLAHYERDRLKDFLGRLLQAVVLDPDGLTLRLHWKIPVRIRDKVASPRGRDLNPSAKLITYTRYRRAA